MIVQDNSLKIFSSSKINGRVFFAGFATKEIGDARQISNILTFVNSIGLGYKQIIILEQIHSVNIETTARNSSERINKIEETDGIITQDSDVILTIRTADCVPIIFADKKNKIAGISHQGWRGSLKRMVQKMIQEMINSGSSKDDIHIAIGPAINECCYNIDEDRYYAFLEEFDGYSKKIFRFRGGAFHLSLPYLNYLLIRDMGIKKENIDFFPFCTSCDQKRFFSFRKNKKADYGEMLSFITILL